MSNLGELRLYCSKAEEIVQEINRLNINLPIDCRKQLSRILGYYLSKSGLQGAYEIMNNKTVSQIFSEFRPEGLNVVSAGEMEGIRYQLFEAPSSKKSDEEPENGDRH